MNIMSLLLNYKFLQTDLTGDSSGNSLELTNSGVTSATDPLTTFGDVAEFDGASFLSLPSADVPSGILGTSSRTFSAWVYPTQTTQNGNIFTYGDTNVHGTFRVVWDRNDKLLTVAFSDRFFQTTTNSVPASTWTHIVVTYDSSVGLRTYINGTLDMDANYTEINTGSGIFSIGNFAPNSNIPIYEGYITDMRAYDSAFDLAAVNVLYTDGPLDIYKLTLEATMYSHMSDIAWGSISGANSYTVTSVVGGDENIIVQNSVDFSVTATNLFPNTSYEFRLYSDINPSTPSFTINETTPILDATSGLELSQRLTNDFTSLVNFNSGEIQEYLNDIFVTGDIVKLEEGDSYVFVKDSENITFTSSSEIKGILTPFQPVGGNTQGFTMDSDTITYDETLNEVSINSVPVAEGQSVIVNGKKVTVFIL